MVKVIQRKYKCGDCTHEWTALHYHKEEPSDTCPECANKAHAVERDGVREILESGKAPSIGGSVVGKAADITMNMLVNDYGIDPSMINDNQREGDVTAKAPPTQTQAKYMETAQSNVKDFLAVGRQAGTLGASGFNGNDIIQQGKSMGLLPDPRRSSQMYRAPIK